MQHNAVWFTCYFTNLFIGAAGIYKAGSNGLVTLKVGKTVVLGPNAPFVSGQPLALKHKVLPRKASLSGSAGPNAKLMQPLGWHIFVSHRPAWQGGKS